MTRHGILIVQDDALLAEGLRIVVEDAGYHVVGVARDTAGADRLALKHHPALAIVDMKLELDVDGIATATALKRAHGLEIMITTGFPDSVSATGRRRRARLCRGQEALYGRRHPAGRETLPERHARAAVVRCGSSHIVCETSPKASPA